jgi:hypothetical protein
LYTKQSAALLSRRNAEPKKNYLPAALSTHVMLSLIFSTLLNFLTAVENVPPLIDGFEQQPLETYNFLPRLRRFNT